MTMDAFIQYFSDSEWLAQFLTMFVTTFIPLISVIASLIGKYKNSATKSLKEFKEQYETEIKHDMEILKQQYELLEQNLKDIYNKIENTSSNTDKMVAMTGIAYTNSNLTASTKTEILNIMKAENVTQDDVQKANETIAENAELDKIETPKTLEKIATEVVESENVEQDKIVL